LLNKSWPKGGDIHVLLRTKVLTCVPGSRCNEGTIWIEEEPEPITPIRLFSKSYLYPNLVNLLLKTSCGNVQYLWFQTAECITSPLNVFRPSISGQEGVFRLPLPEMSTSAWSFSTSPVARFFTVMFHFAVLSSQWHASI
jgi:hypothetical protein